MRRALACVTLVAVITAPGLAAQDGERSGQAFRAEVELITIDVVAVDGEGRPVEDLEPRDFAVKVDGRTREVVSAELVRASEARRLPSADSDTPIISSNIPIPGARRVAIAVDQSRIPPAGITPILRTASRFLEGLTPADYAAFLAFPEPGPRVDFTTDKARVRRVMENSIVGQPSKLTTRAFNISLSEAVALDSSENTLISTTSATDPNYQRTVLARAPTLRRVLERSVCRSLTFEELILPENLETFIFCVQEVRNESAVMALEARTEGRLSLSRLESFLTELALLEGPKTLVLISAGLFNDDLTVLDNVARLAAAARTTVNVIAVDPENGQLEIVNEVAHGQSRTTLQDRQFAMNGLEVIADSTGGALYQGIGTAQGIFERLSSELSAWYILGVERRPGDPEQQRVEVDVRRRGITVRSNRTVVAGSALRAGRTPDDLLRDALSSPVPVSGVPLRVTTFARQDETAGKHRIHVAANVGEQGAAAAEYTIGYVVMDANNRIVTSRGTREELVPTHADAPLSIETSFLLDPGTYTVRVGVVDPRGRRGTVVHPLEVVSGAGGALATSDLIVGNVPEPDETMRPSLEPHVSGRLAAYLELYPAAGEPLDVEVTLEIAEGEASPALAAQPLAIRESAQTSWRAATGVVEAPLSPGRYVARARIHRADSTVRVVTRLFVLEPGEPSTTTTTPARERPQPMSSELRQRTADYISGVVSRLSNIVGREEFVLTDPDRRVTSDILLVRYPGSQRDLLVYRDVSHVDGEPLPDRQERLAELFLKPMSEGLRERARLIALDAQEHVPSALNPLFVLGFLQADFQSRFELTVRDAGSEWPPEVKAVGFVERARPTMLRAGPLGNLDVPASGTAWVEESTGRILQTELRVGSGRSAPAVVTRFTVDERLQVVVPSLMRTRNPDGVATYSEFRRFNVLTDSAVSDPR